MSLNNSLPMPLNILKPTTRSRSKPKTILLSFMMKVVELIPKIYRVFLKKDLPVKMGITTLQAQVVLVYI